MHMVDMLENPSLCFLKAAVHLDTVYLIPKVK